MREQLAQYDKINKATGAIATLFVVLWGLDTGVSNVAPVGVWKSALQDSYTGNWEKEMINKLNQGIIL